MTSMPPVARVCSAEVPIPYAKHLEDAALPQPERTITAPCRSCWPTMTEFEMPRPGRRHDEAGTLVAWHKQPGDTIHRGEIVAEVETDKGIIEIEAFVNGVLDKVLVPVGKKVPVGTVLALIRDDGAAAEPPPRGARIRSEGPPARPTRPAPLSARRRI